MLYYFLFFIADQGSFFSFHLLSWFMVLWKHRRPRYFPVNSKFLFSFSCKLVSFIISFHTKQQYPQICEIQTLTIIIVCRCWMSSSSSTNLFIFSTYFFYIYTHNSFHVILVLFICLVYWLLARKMEEKVIF